MDSGDIDRDGDLLEAVPVLSPLAWHFTYAYPVHQIAPDTIPDAPGEQPTCLVIYRDRSHEVGFLEINPVTKRLLELVGAGNGQTGRQVLEQIATEMNHPNPAVVIEGGTDILGQMHEKDIIPGTRR